MPLNYVFFFPDEMRAEELACYGNPITRTPSYDRLAAEGTRFEQCHVQNPVCSPSRCSLFTGQYVHVHGHRSLWNLIKPDEENLFGYLKEAGYEVRIYGKNDLFSQEAINKNTDVFETKTDWKDYENLKHRVPFGTPGYYDFIQEPMGSKTAGHGQKEDRKENGYGQGLTGDERDVESAIRFLREWKTGDRPFILFLPLTMPHAPYTAPAPWYHLYENADIKGKGQGVNKPVFHRLIRDYRQLGGEQELVLSNRVYKGMVSYVDMLLGRLLDCLEETGLTAGTMLIASSDHGDYAGDYGLVEKWPNGFEDVLTRVPLLIRMPGGAKGHVVKEQVQLMDIFATIMESAGLRTRHTHFSVSLLPQLAGEAGDPLRLVFCEGGYNKEEFQANEGRRWVPSPEKGEGAQQEAFYTCPPDNLYYPKLKQQYDCPDSVCRGVMVRSLTHKLILRSSGENEFYDLRTDKEEVHNRYGENGEEVRERTAALKEALLCWYLDTSDVVPFEADARG